MRQATLKIKNFGAGLASVRDQDLQRKVLHLIFGALGLLSICYAVFLGSMVLNIIERKNLQAEARNITNQIGELELVYFAKSNEIDLSLSSTMGFKETKANFATRKSLGSLKIANNEI